MRSCINVRVFCFLFFCFFLVACESEKDKLKRAMKQVIGKRVELPKFSTARILNEEIEIPLALWEGVKIVVYKPPLLCSSCNLESLESWKRCIDEMSANRNVNFIFIFRTKDTKELYEAIEEYSFNYPVLYDTEGIFIKRNKFLIHPVFYVFLLNKENEIVLIGDPSQNKELWKLYKQEIEILTQK